MATFSISAPIGIALCDAFGAALLGILLADTFQTTASHSTIPSFDRSVGGCKFVSLWAVGLLSMMFTGLATANIFNMRYWLQMLRINAQMNTAKVVQFQPFWDSPYKQFIRNYMGHAWFSGIADPGTSVELTICTSSSYRTHPEPATAFRYWKDEIHKAFRKCSRRRSAWHLSSIQEACA